MITGPGFFEGPGMIYHTSIVQHMHRYCFLGMIFLLWLCGFSIAQPADKDATRETVQLFNNLKKLSGKGFLFGHQDALAYGVEWRYKDNRSDVQEVTGDYPGVYGWDLGG